MRVIVSEIPETGLHQDIRLPVTLEDDQPKNEVHIDINIFRIGTRVLIKGHLETSLSLVCSRCLKEFSYPLDIDFKDEYIPTTEAILGEEYEHELTSDELELSFYSNDEIDIEDLIRGHLLLSVPMKPLCKADCQGICPKCGSDLNMGLCTCKDEEIDPRLSQLKKFKERLSN